MAMTLEDLEQLAASQRAVRAFTDEPVPDELIARIIRVGTRASNARNAQPWHFIGGMLGVVLVTALIIAVPRIGVSQMMVAALAGQLAAAMLIDHYGWLGVETRSFGWKRALAIPLLGAAVWLIRQPN